MKHLFLPYNLALLAKEKGFDEEVLGWYNTDKDFILPLHKQWITIDCEFPKRNSDFRKDGNSLIFIAAPLYQQITDWFREKRNIHISYDRNPIAKNKFMYFYFIKLGNGFDTTAKYSGDFNSVYEALDKAIEQAFTLI